MAGQYTLNANFTLLEETEGTLYNVGLSDIELSSDANKGQGILFRSGEVQPFKGTIYARSLDESAKLNVQNFIEKRGGGDSGGGGGGGTPYTLPTMAQNVKGGAKVGAGLTMTGEVLSLDGIYIPSAVVSQTATGAILTVSDHNGTTTASIKSGADGEDGLTPTFSVDSIEGGNALGVSVGADSWTVNIYNGSNGADGITPAMSTDSISGGNSVTFSTGLNTVSFNVYNGANGTDGTSVSVRAASVEGGNKVTFADAAGLTTITVKDGERGADGKSFSIQAQYPSYASLTEAHPTGEPGDAYLVGGDSITGPDVYVWLEESQAWGNSGKIQGVKGDKGDKGDDGETPTITTASVSGGHTVRFQTTAQDKQFTVKDGADGVSPAVAVQSVAGGHNVTITSASSTDIFTISDGAAGADGVGVSVASASVQGGNAVTLTGAGGSTSFVIKDGTDGQDGTSVTVSAATIVGGHSVTFAADSVTAFNVMDGADGVNGVSPIVSFATIPAGHVMTVSDAQGQKSITIMDGAGSGGSVVEYDCVGVISWQHTLRANCLKLDGATVTASDYPQLLQYVQDNNLTVTAAEWESNCVMYVYDETNDTLKLPDLTNRVPWGVVNNPRSIEAGLPEISGKIMNSGRVASGSTNNDGNYNSGVNRGALRASTQEAGYVVDVAAMSGRYAYGTLEFSASNSDSIYGGSTTVQPPAAGLIPQVRFASDMLSAVVPLYRKNSQAYAVGDVVLSANLPTWARLECVTAGTTASVEPSFSGAKPGQYITDGTVKWVVDDARDGTPVGRVVFDSVLRPGYVKALGATASNASTNYPRIIAYLTENPSMAAADATDKTANPYKWLYDNVNDTLTMPDYTDQFIEGGAAAGVKAAGLPDVTGHLMIAYGTLYTEYQGSALYRGTDRNNAPRSSSYDSSVRVSEHLMFDASRSDSIYGGSNTVQPPAIVSIPQIRY